MIKEKIRLQLIELDNWFTENGFDNISSMLVGIAIGAILMSLIIITESLR